ncbi:response regulator [Saliphagus sp. LR7]|uniref:response regulator n=1 Tax=Saliphagus sp. LR7 TaxID=2282654 RepID=UPI001E4134C9|nr:response regulator [Saliphagus sp. LR7]
MSDARAGSGQTRQEVDILLVEDNPGDVRLTKEAFTDGAIDNTLHVVTDGKEALNFLHQRDEYADAACPDLVLLDLNLPKKSGEEVLEEIRGDEDLQRLPVIILTSSEAQEDVLRSYELQANAYLTKPVDPDAFLDTIQTFEEFWLRVVRLPPCDRTDGG